jgi:hypothetical protein
MTVPHPYPLVLYVLEITMKCSSKNKLKFMLFNRDDEYNFLILFCNLTFCFYWLAFILYMKVCFIMSVPACFNIMSVMTYRGVELQIHSFPTSSTCYQPYHLPISWMQLQFMWNLWWTVALGQIFLPSNVDFLCHCHSTSAPHTHFIHLLWMLCNCSNWQCCWVQHL